MKKNGIKLFALAIGLTGVVSLFCKYTASTKEALLADKGDVEIEQNENTDIPIQRIQSQNI